MTLFRGFSIAFLASLPILACAQEAEDDSFARRDKFVADFCDIVSSCCDKTFGTVVTLEQCRTNVSTFDTAAIEDEVARNTCITQLQAAVTKHSGSFCAKYGSSEIAACPDIRRAQNTGGAKPGEPCTKATDCAPSFEGPVQCNNGGCQLLKRGKEGDLPCTATDTGGAEISVGSVPGPTAYVCHVKDDDVYCDSTSKACTKPKAVGTDCEKTEECIPTAYCNETTKKCQIKKSSESSCSESSECQAPFHCDEGFCRNDLADGDTCKSNDMCRSDNCAMGKCAPPASKDPRLEPVCKAAPPPQG
jgi:hypothetical protein